MKKMVLITVTVIAILLQNQAMASSSAADGATTVDLAGAAASIQQRLDESVKELNLIREQVAAEKVPLSRKLSSQESELARARQEYQAAVRQLDGRMLDLNNLRAEIKARRDEASYISNLISEYTRNFESRLHIAELQRYRQQLDNAKLAADNSALTELEVFTAQAAVLELSLERLQNVMGGAVFVGTASDTSGRIHKGTFVLVGPSAVFVSDDGGLVGSVEQRLGSLEPAVVPFAEGAIAAAAVGVAKEKSGYLPFDPTLGNATKIQMTRETLWQHIKKGGVVMYPIFALAGAAFSVALFKWISFVFIRKPSKAAIQSLLTAVAVNDRGLAESASASIKGPVGAMLRQAVEHVMEPVELIEEVMYEQILSVRLRLEGFLPFISISAASAPLLGLLGTVTGIINTFKLITAFGSGDVKTLSGGISEALITTEFGLIVAIPSLLIHAFLSRKAKSVVNDMEKAAVSFVNQLSKTPFSRDALGSRPNGKTKMASSLMNDRMIRLSESATVKDAVQAIRHAPSDRRIDALFVVDGKGAYAGLVPVQRLFSSSDDTTLEKLAEMKKVYVHPDTREDRLQDLFERHYLCNMPVIDHDGRLVGQVSRPFNGDSSR